MRKNDRDEIWRKNGNVKVKGATSFNIRQDLSGRVKEMATWMNRRLVEKSEVELDLFFYRCRAHFHLWQQCDYYNVNGAHWAKSIFRERDDGISQFTPTLLQNFRKFYALPSFGVVSANGMRIIYLKCFKEMSDLLNSFPNYFSA